MVAPAEGAPVCGSGGPRRHWQRARERDMEGARAGRGQGWANQINAAGWAACVHTWLGHGPPCRLGQAKGTSSERALSGRRRDRDRERASLLCVSVWVGAWGACHNGMIGAGVARDSDEYGAIRERERRESARKWGARPARGKKSGVGNSRQRDRLAEGWAEGEREGERVMRGNRERGEMKLENRQTLRGGR